MNAQAERHVYRRGRIRWLILFTTWWLVVFVTLGGSHVGAPPSLIVSLVALEGALLVLGIAAYRSAVIVEPPGLLIRDLFRVRRLTWAEVAGVEVGRQGAIAGPAATIRLRDGSSVRTPLWSGGLGAGNRATERTIHALIADVEAHLANGLAGGPAGTGG